MAKSKRSLKSKIAHVYDTKDNEKTWVVKNVDGTYQSISRDIIFRDELLTPDTTWTVLKKTCVCRRGINGDKFRFVIWKGFKKPTEEPADLVIHHIQ